MLKGPSTPTLRIALQTSVNAQAPRAQNNAARDHGALSLRVELGEEGLLSGIWAQSASTLLSPIP